MERRVLGRTGVQLSPLTLGTMEFGSKVDEAEARRMFELAIDAGVNTIDTANVYTGGRSEEMVGRLVAPVRDRVVLATKFSVAKVDGEPNTGGTSRLAVISSLEASLRRLGTDYVDILYVHRPFGQTAIDETLRALDDLVRSGKVRYIGTSGFAAWQHVEALWAASDLRLGRPVVEQASYHLLDRRVERELIPALRTFGSGLTVWSPLAGGVLTGKYLGAQPEGARITPGNAWGDKHLSEHSHAAVRRLKEIADGLGVPLLTLSLAWLLAQPGVTSVVLGARTVEQLRPQLDAATLELGDDVLAAIDEVVAPGGVVVPYFLDDGWGDFEPHPHRW